MGDMLKLSYTVNINEELRNSSWCFCYNVYWKNNFNIDGIEWKYKSFHNKKDAKAFAKKMWKEYKEYHRLKPYILEKIVPCNFFKKELFLSLTIIDKDKYAWNYVRRVWGI